MSERDHIKQAIAVLEAQRDVLGDAVVNVTVATLWERFGRVDADGDRPIDRSAQRKQATILFANVTGFSELVETIPDTSMLDVMNVLWHRLDGAITNHGGIIDKHMGNGVLGVFGVPAARENDPERAVRAALAMRAALGDFLADVEAMRRSGDWPRFVDEEGDDPFQKLRLSIGINTGQVMLGDVGTGDEYTVIGDAVNVASRLERAASSGGIFISHGTYLLVRGVFTVEPLGPIPLKGRSESVPVYMVIGVKPRLFYATGRGVEGIETTMVGRDGELRQLQQVLKTAVQQNKGHFVVITGEAGVGKSRLLHEFNNWVRSLSREFATFKGRTYESKQQLPYILFRDLFSARFNIQDNDPAAIVQDKLTRGMRRYIDGDDEEVQTRVRAVAQLLGMEVSDSAPLASPGTEAHQVRDRTYQYIANFFERVTADFPATLLLLEDIHWADDSSLALVDYLASLGHKSPIVIMALARPSLFNRRPKSWLAAENGHVPGRNHPILKMELYSLNQEDSQALVQQILRKIPQIPPDLSDLIVKRSEGNPFYLEELIKILIEDGVIVTGQAEWRVQQNQLNDVRIPPNITGVLQARLDRLSGLERATLQRVAVAGRMFWDTVVIHMNQLADNPIGPADSMVALQALEKREMIFPRQATLLAGSRTYVFKHALLQQVTYESVLLRIRPFYHKQVADWLVEQSGERLAEAASVIARHYELAGEKQIAAELYEMAADRAQDTYKPAIASDYYRRALSLVAEQSLYAVSQLRLQGQLGELLQMQARFVEAAQTYMTMRFTAKEDGDLMAQAQAWIGLAGVQREQANYEAMLHSAIQAEEVAWLVNAEMVLAQALIFKSEAYLHTGRTNEAVAAASQALALNERLDAPDGVARSLSMLTRLATEAGQPDQVSAYLKQIDKYLALLADRMSDSQSTDLKRSTAFVKSILGNLYNYLGRFEKATFQLLDALNIYREIDYQSAIGNTLNSLGETVRLRGNAKRALPLYREAMVIAEVTGDVYGALLYRANLGAALVELGQYEAAVSHLRQVIELANDVGKIVNWYGLAETYASLAQARTGLGETELALETAQNALKVAQKQQNDKVAAVSWRIIGQTLAQCANGPATVEIDDQLFTASNCFAKSLNMMKTWDVISNFREQAHTLWRWSHYEMANGNQQLGRDMKQEAISLAEQLRIRLPAR